MFDDELPEFDEREMHTVLPLVKGLFGEHFVKLATFDDGHFRVIFDKAYFVLQEDATSSSKSQWSSLKKRLKRRDRLIFVFKESGSVDCHADGDEEEQMCYYLDFGFFLA